MNQEGEISRYSFLAGVRSSGLSFGYKALRSYQSYLQTLIHNFAVSASLSVGLTARSLGLLQRARLSET
jgi:hypothetical protein